MTWNPMLNAVWLHDGFCDEIPTEWGDGLPFGLTHIDGTPYSEGLTSQQAIDHLVYEWKIDPDADTGWCRHGRFVGGAGRDIPCSPCEQYTPQEEAEALEFENTRDNCKRIRVAVALFMIFMNVVIPTYEPDGKQIVLLLFR